MTPAILVCLGACAAAQSFAGDAPAAADAKKTQVDSSDPRVPLAKIIGGKPEELQPSPVPGIYEFVQGADVGYVTSDGKYFFSGDLYEINSRTNLSDARRTDLRKRLLASVPESEMMIFGPAAPKYTVTVFTDVDCGFCRKLHSDIREINRLGVRVRYLFYPRSGPGSESWKVAEKVWCSRDRKDALTRAKLGEEIKARDCGPTPVMKQWKLGQDLGVDGTPAIFTESGGYVQGYLAPGWLVEQIKETLK